MSSPRRHRRPPALAASLLVLVLVVAVVVAVALVAARSSEGGPEDEPAGTPRAVPGRSAVVWAIGDGADGGEAARQVAGLVAASDPARVLYLGDVYEHGTADEFKHHFAPVYGELATRMLPVPGNHDWPEHASGYDPYWENVLGRPLPHFYENSIAGWQVLSLNSQEPMGAGSAQQKWLQGRLRGPGTCRIAFWHRPLLSLGKHRDGGDTAPLWDALAGHAVLVLNGHDHDFQRFNPRDGIVEMVTGAGGRGLYHVDASDPRLAFSDDRHFGATRLELAPGRVDVSNVAADGTVLDRSTIRCRR